MDKIFENAIPILKDNVAIEKVNEKCIDCGICKRICEKREGITDICNGKACVNCGQCIQACPTGALRPKSDIDKLKTALEAGKICIAYTAPSVRVSIGDKFGMEKGEFAQGKLITALRKLGFSYVLDVTFGADLTIIEEANELVDRIINKKSLPMITSCCPSWVKYAEMFYPEVLPNISTCKSPIGMQGEIVANYFTKKNNLDRDDIFTVAITPCTAKKYEISKKEIMGTDCVITASELTETLKEAEIDFKNLEEGQYDSLLGEGTGAGMIFGNTGGVMEAALRTVYNLLTDKELDENAIEFTKTRGMENVKEFELNINDMNLKVAVINEMSSAKPILEDIKNGNSPYQFIEIMNCLGGCIGGGGQPKPLMGQEKETKEKRLESLYEKDKKDKLRVSYKNEDVERVYQEFVGEPLSEKSEKLLHTKYEDKSNIIK